MTDQFDLELRDRLTRLSDAVPVPDRAPAGIVRPIPVQAINTGRVSHRGLLLPLSASAVAVVFFTAISQVGPPPAGSGRSTGTAAATPGAPSTQSGQLATDRDGDFELQLTSDKSIYRPDEPINVSASLIYRGSEHSIDVVYEHGGPVVFGIRERVFGAVDVMPVSDLMCGPKHAKLTRDAPLIQPFQKRGGFPGNDPRAEAFKAFMLDPVLRLPEGTWHIYARGGVGPGCGSLPSPSASLQAEIVITVAIAVSTP
jgi:hypothetical protein